MNTETKEQIHSCLKQLAAVCDGAHERDDTGFSANHTSHGRWLASIDSLNDISARQGWEIIRHYKRQLGDVIDKIGMELLINEESDDDLAYSFAGTTISHISGGTNIQSISKNDKRFVADPDSILTEALDDAFPLTDEQEQALEKIIQWLDGPDRLTPYKQGGYAGTGKTTLIKVLRSEIARRYYSVVTAFTGKAVNVLQKKGLRAQTAHSLMYDVHEDKDGSIYFEKKSSLKDNPDLIIWDEASMVSSDLLNTALSFGVPILFVGDPGQLPPVGDNPNLMLKPDNVLEKIHRQAELSPIIRFATNIRLGRTAKPVPCEEPGLTIKPKIIRASEYLTSDQVICAKNVTRQNTNTMIRMQMGLKEKLLPNEKLICLRNDRRQGVFNGMHLTVKEIVADSSTYWMCNLEDEVGQKFNRMKVWKEPFILPMAKQDQIRVPYQHVWCDYGYCITCHKSQGSEWNKVLVLDEWMPPQVWDMKRWRYTAITRAAKELIYCV